MSTGPEALRHLQFMTKAETTMGIWKVRSLHACRKVQKLTQELKCYRGVILGLAEIRWTGFGGTVTDEGHKIWYCGEDSKHQDGVARKEVVGSVIGCTPMSSRLISILISARPYNNMCRGRNSSYMAIGHERCCT